MERKCKSEIKNERLCKIEIASPSEEDYGTETERQRKRMRERKTEREGQEGREGGENR